MSTQTTQIARSVRLSQWMEQIRDCQNRPRDMSVVEWCRAAGISKQGYYYRLKCVREGFLEAMTPSVPVSENRVVPVPAALMCGSPNMPGTAGDPDRDTLQLTITDVTVTVHSHTSPELLTKVLQVIRHAE